VLNIMNSAGNPVVIAGYSDEGRGGAVSVKNGRGVQVFAAGSDAEDRGKISVWNEEGRKPRVIDPN